METVSEQIKSLVVRNNVKQKELFDEVFLSTRDLVKSVFENGVQKPYEFDLSESAKKLKEEALKESVSSAFQNIQEKGVDIPSLFELVFQIAYKTREALENVISQDFSHEELPEILQAQLPKDTLAREFFFKNDFYTKNLYLNWLRLLGFAKLPHYNKTVQNSGCNIFIEEDQQHSDFSEWVHRFYPEGSLKGKTLLELGPGFGRDLDYYASQGAKCFSIESSKKARNKVVEITEKKSHTNIKKPFLADMYKKLKKLETGKQKFDLIVGLSSIHYFSEQKTQELLRSLYKVLNKEGRVCVSIKKPKTTFHNAGLAIRETEKESEILGIDGQVRYFRPKEVWQELFTEAGFEVSVEDGVEIDYEYPGQGEVPFIRIMAMKK